MRLIPKKNNSVKIFTIHNLSALYVIFADIVSWVNKNFLKDHLTIAAALRIINEEEKNNDTQATHVQEYKSRIGILELLIAHMATTGSSFRLLTLETSTFFSVGNKPSGFISSNNFPSGISRSRSRI